MGRSLIATTHHSSDQEELISGRNILFSERQGANYPLRRKDQGRNVLGRKVLVEEEMIWDKTTRILDGKVVTCFTHYKINLKQTLKIEEAFRKLWFTTKAIAESRMACETLHYSTFLYFYWILLHYYCIFLDLYLMSGHFYSICFVSIRYSMNCIQYPFIFIL